MRYHIVRRTQPDPPASTVLGQTAALLSPGQCIRLPITIAAAHVTDGGAPVFKWASSACWSPTSREVLGVYKRQDAAHSYKFLRFHEDTNAVDIATPAGDTSVQSGHGYDHNAIDPVADEFFFRQFNDDSGPYMWSGGAWSKLAAFGGQVTDAASLTYVPGIGLLAVDRVRMRLYDRVANSWSVFKTLGGADQNHVISEYNAISNALIFGGGNGGDTMFMMDCASPFAVTSIPTPPYDCGSSDSGGLCVSDPAGPGFIINEKGTTQWHFWKPGDSSWTALTQSSGSGATAQIGLPNFVTGIQADAGASRIAAPISTYGVMWFMEYVGGADVARIWLAKHS